MSNNEINRTKRVYWTKKSAKKAIQNHADRFHQKMRMYRCKCRSKRHYHLTSQSSKENLKRKMWTRQNKKKRVAIMKI